MKRVVIIHGWGGSPDEPMHKWLKAELLKNGCEVVAPEMPDSETPRIGAWVSKIKEIAGEPDEEAIFVGHSIGCQAILRYLEKLPPPIKVGGVVFIAPWLTLQNLESDEERQIADPWLKTPIREKDVMRHIPKMIAIFSDDDPYVAGENINFFQDKFNAEIIIESKKGHFTEEDGVFELPSVFDAILAIK